MRTLWLKAFSNSFPIDKVAFERYNDKLLLSVRLGRVKGATYSMVLTPDERDALLTALLKDRES